MRSVERGSFGLKKFPRTSDRCQTAYGIRTPAFLGDLGDAAGADAGGANSQRLSRALNEGTDTPQIGVPTALGHVVGVTDPVAVNGRFSTDFANLGHFNTSKVRNQDDLSKF
jgi:hypothetical protein